MNKEKQVCCICGQSFEGYGNNPSPMKINGRCCDKCNEKVIATRLLLSKYQSNEQPKAEIVKMCSENNKEKTIVVGSEVIIIDMKNEKDYAGRYGVIVHIDDIGQLHGSWGGCALIPDVDIYLVL